MDVVPCVGESGVLPAWGVGPGLWLVGFQEGVKDLVGKYGVAVI